MVHARAIEDLCKRLAVAVDVLEVEQNEQAST
jgi:hypothetical protein